MGLTQPQLDFVHVDIDGDVPVFIDPRALLLINSEWASECVELIKDFFGEVLAAIRAGDPTRAEHLLGVLREPNETRLGFSKGTARGHALGPELAGRVREALARSEAVKSGLLTDLEDTILMIEGIGPDMVSDITTNVIREPLVEYTRLVASEHGIPMEPDVWAGPFWDPEAKDWRRELSPLPKPHRPLVLVPKSIVRRDMDYDDDEYYDDYLIPYIRELEIDAGSSLVKTLKDGTPRVTKKALIEKYGRKKRAIEKLTRDHPEVLDRYRAAKTRVHPPLGHQAISDVTGTPPPDWSALLGRVRGIAAGNAGATSYENAVEALLTPLFYPALSMPQKQVEIHDGRKRIDITYANSASRGFF